MIQQQDCSLDPQLWPQIIIFLSSFSYETLHGACFPVYKWSYPEGSRLIMGWHLGEMFVLISHLRVWCPLWEVHKCASILSLVICKPPPPISSVHLPLWKRSPSEGTEKVLVYPNSSESPFVSFGIIDMDIYVWKWNRDHWQKAGNKGRGRRRVKCHYFIWTINFPILTTPIYVL